LRYGLPIAFCGHSGRQARKFSMRMIVCLLMLSERGRGAGSLVSNIPGEDFRALGYAVGDKVEKLSSFPSAKRSWMFPSAIRFFIRIRAGASASPSTKAITRRNSASNLPQRSSFLAKAPRSAKVTEKTRQLLPAL